MKLVQIRLDDELFANAAGVLDNLGLDVPTAFRLYMKAIVRERGIPFDIRERGTFVEEVPVDAEIRSAMDKVATVKPAVKKKRR